MECKAGPAILHLFSEGIDHIFHSLPAMRAYILREYRVVEHEVRKVHAVLELGVILTVVDFFVFLTQLLNLPFKVAK